MGDKTGKNGYMEQKQRSTKQTFQQLCKYEPAGNRT